MHVCCVFAGSVKAAMLGSPSAWGGAVSTLLVRAAAALRVCADVLPHLVSLLL